MLAALLTLALLLGIIRLLAPKSSKGVAGWFPRADRGVDRDIRGQTERRGAVLAALAAASLTTAFAGAQAGEFGGLILFGVGAAILFRFFPEPGSAVLGLLGTMSALVTSVGDSCVGVEAERRVLTFAVVVFGLGTFAVLRLMFGGVGLARGGPVTFLNLFGLIQLGTFVATPFGLALTDLTGLGNSFIAAIALYGIVIAFAAILPDFAVSIIGVALLAATLSVDTLIGDTCTARQGTAIAVLAGFALAWWIAGRFGRS